MKAKPIEINWHDREAVYSVDFSPNSNRVVTAGADGTVRIWSIVQRAQSAAVSELSTSANTNMPVEVDFLSELKRHTAPVNVARFSPSGLYIASAGDDTNVIIWKPTDVKQVTFGSGNADYEKESWVAHAILRGHTKEIYDLAWSPCGRYFITGAIDNTACVWNLEEKKCIKVLADHTHYVQGVAWDPLGKYIATQSSDRSVAMYKCTNDNHGNLVIGSCAKKHYKLDRSKLLSNIAKGMQEDNVTNLPSTTAPATSGQTFRLFQDENLVSFFRRLAFSNDGALLITPAGLYKQTNDDNVADMDTDDTSSHGGDGAANNDTQNTIYVYARNTVTQQPVAFFGNYSKAAIAVKYSPVKYQLRSKRGIVKPSQFALPYRMVFAVATQDAVFVYDTQQSKPLCMLSGMHYASITDISWSSDGNVLMLTSNDGYCSVAVYDKEELGIPYEGESARPAGDMLEKMPIVQEPPQIKTAEQPRPLTALDTWARKVESPTIAPATSPSRDNKRPMAAAPAEAKPGENSQQKKKRRIAPTLISSL